MGNPFPWGCVSLITTAPLSCLYPPWIPKAGHLMTMCSAASTYSDVQEFQKPQNQQLLTSFSIWKIDNLPFFFFSPFKVSPLIQRAGSRPGSGRLPALTTTCMQYWSLLARRGWHLPVRRRSRVDRSLSQDRQSALCWLFGGVQSSLKCTSNGSLILHPCDVTAHLTNTIRGPCSFSFSVFFFCCLEKPRRSYL